LPNDKTYGNTPSLGQITGLQFLKWNDRNDQSGLYTAKVTCVGDPTKVTIDGHPVTIFFNGNIADVPFDKHQAFLKCSRSISAYEDERRILKVN
jgi:hypothetical protein